MKNIPFFVCIILWIFITLLRVFTHQPWYDEAHAWEIARSLEFRNFFESMKLEGHFPIWYLLLMPFAKFDFAYPYSMLMLNWIFCFAAIFLLWRFSPFNNWLKFLISFSFPFLACYPVVARCYSVGILPIFLLAMLYKNKLKYPIIYASLIFFAMNTSFVAILGTGVLGLYLIFDLYKEKDWKNFAICSGIALVTFIFLVVQVLNFQSNAVPIIKVLGLTLQTILSSFSYLNPILNAILLAVLAVGFLVCLFKEKRMFFFVIFVFTSLLATFKLVYAGDFWHYYFLYIYLIVACWIGFEQNNISEKMKKVLTILLSILSFLLIFDVRNEIKVFHSHSKDVANHMKSHKNDSLLLVNQVFSASIPYLRDGKTDYDIKYIQSQDRTHNIQFNLEFIKNAMNLNKNNYLYVNSCSPIPELTNEKYVMKFNLDANIKNIYCIYKIELSEKKK